MNNPRYFDLLINKIAWGLFVLGPGPLLLVTVLAKIGIWPDSNPNPVGLGILALFTFWPAVICLVTGLIVWLWKNLIFQRT